MPATTAIKVTPHARRFAAVRAGYAALAAEDDYHAETEEWGATNADGLGED